MRTSARTIVAGSVAGLGLAVGGLAVATADDGDTPAPPGASDRGPGAPGERGGPGGPHGGPRGEWGPEFAAALAEELGIDADRVEEAWDAVREDLRPDPPAAGEEPDGERPTPPTPPTEEEQAERLAAIAAALATELDLDADRVETALETVSAEFREQREAQMADMEAEIRSDLVERLDAAVADDTLTAADKASVLKAFDAGLLGPGAHGPR